MEEDIKVLEEAIKNTQYEDIGSREIQAIENLIKRVKDLEEIEQVHKEQNGELQKQLSENEADLTSVYLKGVYDERDKWKSKVKELKKKHEEARDLAGEQLITTIIIADSDSLNYGRIQAHNVIIKDLEELLQE